MVDNIRLIPETAPPSPFPNNDDARKTPGPIYDLDVLQEVVSGDIIFPVTRKVLSNLESLEWDVDDVALAIKSMQQADYKGSEWCQALNGMKFDADVYVVPYDHTNECRDPRNVRYYIKFGFYRNKLNLALISCHI